MTAEQAEMKSFIVEIKYLVRVEDPYAQTLEDLRNKYDIGSRCFENYIEQTAKHIEQLPKKGFCSCHRMELEVIREATEQDKRSFPEIVK